MQLPSPNSLFLSDFLASLRKRVKALKHKWFQATCDRVIVRDGEIDTEMLEIKTKLATREGAYAFHVKIYEDRWINVFARRRVGQKVLWDWSAAGRLIRHDEFDSLVSLIEATSDELATLGDMQTLSPEHIKILDHLWSGLVVRGPIGVVK